MKCQAASKCLSSTPEPLPLLRAGQDGAAAGGYHTGSGEG
jgi:hypothetical protein